MWYSNLKLFQSTMAGQPRAYGMPATYSRDYLCINLALVVAASSFSAVCYGFSSGSVGESQKSY